MTKNTKLLLPTIFVCTIIFSNIAYGATEISDGSVKALYHLSDTVDASGNGYNLTNNNSVSFNTGILSNAADFGTSNANKYLNVANDLSIEGGTISVCTWTNISTQIGAGTYNLFDQADATTDVQYSLRYVYNGGTRQIQYVRGKIGVGDQAYAENITLTVGTWYHLCLRYNGTILEAWRNGSNVGSAAASGSGSGGGTDGFTISSYVGGPGNYYSGLIDETVITNSNLSTTTILSLYNSGNGSEVCITAGCAAVASTSTISTFMSTSTDQIVGYFFGYGTLFLEIMLIGILIAIIIKLFTKT